MYNLLLPEKIFSLTMVSNVFPDFDIIKLRLLLLVLMILFFSQDYQKNRIFF